jgi:hypothetical protein
MAQTMRAFLLASATAATFGWRRWRKLPSQRLRAYARYYNNIRTHRSLDNDAPAFRSVQQVGTITSHVILGGLHHRYVRV